MKRRITTDDTLFPRMSQVFESLKKRPARMSPSAAAYEKVKADLTQQRDASQQKIVEHLAKTPPIREIDPGKYSLWMGNPSFDLNHPQGFFPNQGRHHPG